VRASGLTRRGKAGMVTVTMSDAPAGAIASGLWRRELGNYPRTGARVAYLAIVILATIMLYYELYIAGAVNVDIIADYGMTFSFYVYITVAANAIGAFGSLVAGLGDRYGRANLVAYGLVVSALLTLFAIPNAHGKWEFAVLLCLTGLIEGIILVATPALIRDFSPQHGRGAAMGFWALGPVVGSLVVAVVSSNTLGHLHPWQDQFVICGIAGLVVGVIALAGLRELSLPLRQQLMVSLRDRALVEARARGIDVRESMRHPWRQMLRPDVIGASLSSAVFLLVYFTAVGFFTVYFTTLHHYSLSRANSLGDWYWGADAVGLIVAGIVSDWLRVRKPFMVAGSVLAIVATIVFINLGTSASYGAIAVWIGLIAFGTAIAYAPWFASFTETLERVNPALTATGLAIGGWILRAVVAISIGIMPLVVTSMTPLVEYGPTTQVLAARYAQEVATAQAIDPATLAALNATPPAAAAETRAVGEISARFKINSADAIGLLLDLSKVPKADLNYLSAHGQAVANAESSAASQWKDWWAVCVGGMLFFLPFIPLVAGRWSPRKAREDAAEHARAVQAELDALAPLKEVP
jgi:sugar phosphate permease